MLDAALHVEDVTYVPQRPTCLLSSIRKKKILALDSTGRFRDFTTEGQDGVWAMMALAVDSKRRILWASTAELDSSKSALLAYDLKTGKLRKRMDLADGKNHVMGDMALGPKGEVYISDSFSLVYTVP